MHIQEDHRSLQPQRQNIFEASSVASSAILASEAKGAIPDLTFERPACEVVCTEFAPAIRASL